MSDEFEQFPESSTALVESAVGLPMSQVPEFDCPRCRALLSILTSMVWASDPEGRVVVPHASWSAYTGQQWPQPEGDGWMAAIQPEDRDLLRDEFARATRTGSRFTVQCRVWHAGSASYRRCEVNGVPVFAESGRITEWLGTCRDVEEQWRAQQILVEQDHRKDEFIAVLAHELRNPLAPIRNAVQVLKLRGNGDMQLSWARSMIERQVAHMAHLLDDLLDVSRIRQNKLELHKVRVTLDSILDAAIESSRPNWEQAGQQFELNVLAAPIFIEADGGRLAQAFTNLLNNASKYTPRGGRIALTVRQEGNEAVVEVEDNGIGIRPETLPRVFDLFTQDAPALSRAQGGLGIGLAIVRALVAMHGGTVGVESEGAGKGSCFTVRLPSASRRESNATSRAGADRRLKVLVADDNRDAAESMSVLIEMFGHDARIASDGEEALRIAHEFHPDLALLDLGMPKANGYEVATALRAEPSPPVLVAVTGWGQPEDRQRSQAAGFDRHLVKPVDPDEIETLLRASQAAKIAGS